MAKHKPYVASRDMALWGGYAGIVIGSWLLYDAYERRGRSKPFVAKFLPGP